MRTFVCWVGITDIRAAKGEPDAGLGPIGQTLKEKSFHEALFLMDAKTGLDRDVVAGFFDEVSEGKLSCEFRLTGLENPTDFHAINKHASEALTEVAARDPDCDISILLSSGTPAMAAVWILLSATMVRSVELLQSSLQQGVVQASVPFDIHAEYVPQLVRAQGERVAEAVVGAHIDTPEFDDIVSQSTEMALAKERAQKVAVYDVPVLILGESGTGKELFAKAICRVSTRTSDPVVVNCGAFPPNLLESILFGYVKGAFTGAAKNTEGVFEAANGGTVFLDEIGEMPLEAQTRLLRLLQEQKVLRVGDTKERDVDIRVISATNRDLRKAVTAGEFREDLYYRLAVTTLNLPPLRDRSDDLQLLADTLLPSVARTLGATEKNLTPGARNVLAVHTWPGNVRELQATLTRALIWSTGERITEADIQQAIESSPISPAEGDVMNHPLGNRFNIKELLKRIEEAYARRALEEANGVKAKAARLLGQRQQTFSEYLKREGIETSN